MFLIWRKYLAYLLRSVVMASLFNDVPSQNHCKIVNIKWLTYINTLELVSSITTKTCYSKHTLFHSFIKPPLTMHHIQCMTWYPHSQPPVWTWLYMQYVDLRYTHQSLEMAIFIWYNDIPLVQSIEAQLDLPFLPK